jgi:hypothetical protein
MFWAWPACRSRKPSTSEPARPNSDDEKALGSALGFCRRVVLRVLIERPGLILLEAGEAADHY